MAAAAGRGASGRAREQTAGRRRRGSANMTIDLGKVGIWSRALHYNKARGARAAAAAELEELGCSAIFIPDVGGDVLDADADLLAATRREPPTTRTTNTWLGDPSAG